MFVFIFNLHYKKCDDEECYNDVIAGSEWRYVILSMVRSCPSNEIEPYPSREWLSKHIGFVSDENQINVGITRAQNGLCILGNPNITFNYDFKWYILNEIHIPMS